MTMTAADQLAAMYETLRNEPNADEMDFMVKRPPELQREGTTFSTEALQEFGAAVNTFIAARVVHHWEAKEGGTSALGPTVVRAEVRLTIDGVHAVPDEDRRPWYVIDGQARPRG